MKIQLLYFQGCPNVDAARAAVRAALAADELAAPIEEIDVEAASAPTWARGWGSPTILVDGADVMGAERASSSACRLYAGGGPDVGAIRRAIAAARAAEPVASAPVALPMVGAMAAALAASACCLVPAVLAAAGVAGTGFAAGFAPYRAYFLIATAIAIGVGVWFAYRPQRDECGCALPQKRRAARTAIWITALLTAGVAAYPLLVGGTATAGSSAAQAKATLHLKVVGMDCEGCTRTIAGRIKKVAGVVSATVDFESGLAEVRHDGRDGAETAVIAAVADVGFRADRVDRP